MNHSQSHTQITISNDRIRSIAKFINKGDIIPIVVQSILDEARYLIRMHGIDLIAFFEGVFHVGENLFVQVVQVSPNIGLRLLHQKKSFSKRVAFLKKYLNKISGNFSIFPYIGDLHNLFEVKYNKIMNIPLLESEKKNCLLRIRTKLEDMVFNIDKDCFFSFEQTQRISNMLSIRKDLEELLMLSSGENSSDYGLVQGLIQECDDILVSLFLMTEFRTNMNFYVQVPVKYNNLLGTMEGYFSKESLANSSWQGNVFFHHASLKATYFKAVLNFDEKLMVIQTYFASKDRSNSDKILKAISLLANEHSLHVKFIIAPEKDLKKSNNFAQIVNIKQLKNFTFVA